MRQEIDSNPQIKYPNGYHEDVLLVIMEAWQCLLSEGFVAQKPNNLPRYMNPTSTTKYFVTRRGKEIETLDDFQSYRKADLLRKHQLHPTIAEKVWSIFSQGSYSTAVLEAFKQVEIAVRKGGGFPEKNYGVPLMGMAFDDKKGRLTDMRQHEAERKGKCNLFAGAIGLYKNCNQNPLSTHDPHTLRQRRSDLTYGLGCEVRDDVYILRVKIVIPGKIMHDQFKFIRRTHSVRLSKLLP